MHQFGWLGAAGSRHQKKGLCALSYTNTKIRRLINNSHYCTPQQKSISSKPMHHKTINHTRFVRALRALPRDPEGFYNKILRNVRRQMSGQQTSNRHMSPSARIFLPSFSSLNGWTEWNGKNQGAAGNLNARLWRLPWPYKGHPIWSLAYRDTWYNPME